jgi:uncharacterized protein YegJ (DUF2314 family)
MPDLQRLGSLSLLVFSLLALLVSSCTPEPPRPLAPQGGLMQDQISYELAVFYPKPPAGIPLKLLDALLQEEEFSLFKPGEGAAVKAQWITDAQGSYSPPDEDVLIRYFGHGLTPDQAKAVSRTDLALVLRFDYRKQHAWKGAKAATRLLSRLARETGGVIWDDESREAFTPETWDRRRLDSWKKEVPVLSKHFTIHIYQDGELVRQVSLGLAKFGLPDLVVEESSWSSRNQVGDLMNLLAQAMAEGQQVGESGQIELNLKAIKSSQARDPVLQTLKANATGVARLTLREGIHEEGDPENRLFEIVFNRYAGDDNQARQEEALSTFFGWEDSFEYIQHDEEVLVASRRAREKLPALREEFNRGLAPGEHILLKAPFENQDGGREWMWVEVTSWNGDDIKGLLQNEPQIIPDLQAGQTVKISEEKVFDYIRRLPDGKEEGNETAAALERSAARKQGN